MSKRQSRPTPKQPRTRTQRPVARRKVDAQALTPQEAEFTRQYLVDLNATHAAIRAGYSAKSARSQGCRLLTRRNIEAAIAKLQEERNARTRVTADRVVLQLARIAFAEMRQFVRWRPAERAVNIVPCDDGGTREVPFDDALVPDPIEVTVVPSDQVAADDHPAVLEISSKHVKLEPRLPALRLLAEHTGVISAGRRGSGGDGDPDGDDKISLTLVQKIYLDAKRLEADVPLAGGTPLPRTTR